MPGEVGFFLATAHPAKFQEKVERIIGDSIAVPPRLQRFMQGKKRTVPIRKSFADFKDYLLNSSGLG